jgi:hypothetical protein
LRYVNEQVLVFGSRDSRVQSAEDLLSADPIQKVVWLSCFNVSVDLRYTA